MVAREQPSMEHHIKLLRDYVQKYGTDRLPGGRENESIPKWERDLAEWRYHVYRRDREGTLLDDHRQEIESIHPRFFVDRATFTRRSFHQVVDDLAQFYREHNALPNQSGTADEVETYQAITLSRYVRMYHQDELTDDQVQYIQDVFPQFFHAEYRKRPSPSERLQELEEWYEEHDHRPRYYAKDEEERDLGQWMKNQMTLPPAKSETVAARRRRVRELVERGDSRLAETEAAGVSDQADQVEGS